MDKPPSPQGVIPYLVLPDAAAAIDFYGRAFGAQELHRAPTPDGQRIMHATLRINGGLLYLSDDFPEMKGRSSTPQAFGGSPVSLSLHVPDVDAAVARAEAAGATLTMPPQDMFWGERFAKVDDPFGYGWSFSAPGRQMSEAEAQSQIEAAFPKS